MDFYTRGTMVKKALHPNVIFTIVVAGSESIGGSGITEQKDLSKWIDCKALIIKNGD